MKLSNQIAIVTGGGRGIGRQTAIDLAQEGCKVMIASRSESELQETVAVIREFGGEADRFVGDLTRQENAQGLMKATLERFGPPTILINNAGVLRVTPFEEITMEEWDSVMDVNLRSVFILSQLALKEMMKHRRGYIINISSTAALDVSSAHASYGASKAGVGGLTQSLRKAASPYGIKVSAVYPGMTETQMVKEFHEKNEESSWLLPQDISDCIMFLLRTSERCLIKDLIPVNR
ncbi:SDR family NAD(P)-dependent oxidoreductase [Paenibacillus sp. CF384]|uniref:SDR family NAD(P)-dependent oxidoreductase n=1 Tax=Paenibacillus sp. CF384 TaxID=1884382 RepID=UPI00089DA68C|nr:SDR family oxidoreductase [Paenibacillus sp. CF384]SDW48231.1 3-oxoacyl-[acyl-carrier protein] reductase [Paenibacillus sp. CF384]